MYFFFYFQATVKSGQPQCGLCATLFEKPLDLKKHVCEVAIEMYKDKSSITIDEDSSDDNEMEQDETDIDLEFKPEASSNDTVSEIFHVFVPIAFIWQTTLQNQKC